VTTISDAKLLLRRHPLVVSTHPLVGSSHGVVRSLTNFLYFITNGIFVAMYVFYSLPAQLLSEESVVKSEWQKEGFTCKPLQKVTIGGLSTDWTFDECVAGVSIPNAKNIKAVSKLLNATHFDLNSQILGMETRVS